MKNAKRKKSAKELALKRWDKGIIRMARKVVGMVCVGKERRCPCRIMATAILIDRELEKMVDRLKLDNLRLKLADKYTSTLSAGTATSGARPN